LPVAPWEIELAPVFFAISTRRLAISGRAIEVPSRYSPSYTVLQRNIGKTKSRTNSSRRSSMKMFFGLMPICSALARAGSSSSPCPRSAVKVTTSQW
jgi:hypothetical protein